MAMSVARTLLGTACSTSSALPSGPHPRRFDRLLQASCRVDQVDQRLHRAWEDSASPGQAERVNELAVAQTAITGDIEVGRACPAPAIARGPGRDLEVHVNCSECAEAGSGFCANRL